MSHAPRLQDAGALAPFFGASHDVLAIVDERGRIVAVSPSAERVLGFVPAELTGRRALDHVRPRERSGARSVAARAQAGASLDLDATIRGADGRWVPMRWSLSPGPGGRIYAVGRDLTEVTRYRAVLVRQEMAELRLRTARELHDGILQTLTGAGLQIAVARKLLRSDPAAAETVLETLASSVAAEQQEMRLYVDEMKGRTSIWADETQRLPERIEGALDRVEAIWGVSISLETRIPGGIGGELERQVLRIVQEAIVNAARHGSAKKVSVSVVLDGPEIVIVISDDGKGFSFLGEYDDAALKEKRLGPLSLKHRVQESGGLISIHSRAGGSTISVRLPVHAERAG